MPASSVETRISRWPKDSLSVTEHLGSKHPKSHIEIIRSSRPTSQLGQRLTMSWAVFIAAETQDHSKQLLHTSQIYRAFTHSSLLCRPTVAARESPVGGNPLVPLS